MNRTLDANLTRTFDGRPLAVIDGLPGGGAELTPPQLRALAATLLRIADDAEARPMGKHFLRKACTYDLAASGDRRTTG
jgi:hypothetical protein